MKELDLEMCLVHMVFTLQIIDIYVNRSNYITEGLYLDSYLKCARNSTSLHK